MAAHPQRVVWLAGASGLVGRELLRGLLDDPGVRAVHTFGRRTLPTHHVKLAQHALEAAGPGAAAPAGLEPPGELYLALGTTIKAAGSQTAFRAVDFEANLALARMAERAGATKTGVVSAVGADPGSRVFYSRVKGELEQALRALAFDGLVIARPSMLAGDRHALGQPARPAEALALSASRLLGPLVPAAWRPVAARDVAAALLAAVPAARGCVVLRSEQMQGAADRRR